MANRIPGRKSMASDRTKSAGNNSHHDIDPSGDLMLEVGDPATSIRIQASSKALSLASPVFAAMFSPGWAKSTPVTPGEWRNITLPDDDPSAMTTFCNAVHLRSSQVSVASFASVEKLSVLCDKYDCAEAFSPWITRWLSNWQGSMDGEDGYMKMLCVSYGFKDHEAFWTATSNVLICYDAAAMANASSNETSDQGFLMLPDQLLDELDMHRKTLLQGIHKGIEAAIEPFLQESNAEIASKGYPQGSMTFTLPQRNASLTTVELGGFGSFGSHTWGGRGAPPPPPARNGMDNNRFNDRNTNSSCSSAMKIGLFLLELSRLELWPLSEKIMAASVQAVLSKASQFKGIGEPASGCRCRTCTVSFKEMMTTLAREQLGKVGGLCLRCVRAGRRMPDSGNCQNKEFCVVGEGE